jgi:hypothetical protein
VQIALLDKLRKCSDVFGKKHGVVQQFLVAFIAVNCTLTFMSPRANLKNADPLGAASISRAPKETFRHVVVLAGV